MAASGDATTLSIPSSPNPGRRHVPTHPQSNLGRAGRAVFLFDLSMTSLKYSHARREPALMLATRRGIAYPTATWHLRHGIEPFGTRKPRRYARRPSFGRDT